MPRLRSRGPWSLMPPGGLAAVQERLKPSTQHSSAHTISRLSCWLSADTSGVDFQPRMDGFPGDANLVGISLVFGVRLDVQSQLRFVVPDGIGALASSWIAVAEHDVDGLP